MAFWYFLLGLWARMVYFFGWLFPIFARAGDYHRWSKGVRWTIHLVLLVVIVVGLYVLNRYVFEGKRLIPKEEFLGDSFLAILFLLIYVLCWLGWWLYKLLVSEEDASNFPDIDEAWQQAVIAMGKEGINVTEVPLFLMLGRPEAKERAILSAAQIQLVVRQTPERDDAPIHVYANHEGIYVSCLGASLLGRHAALLGGEFDLSGERKSSGEIEVQGEGGGEVNPYETMAASMMKQGKGGIGEFLALKAQADAEGRSLSGREQRRMRELSGLSVPQLVKEPGEISRLTARLEHLCRLIVRDRRPYCPLNGIMLLLPFGGADTDENANHTGEFCQRDLATARRVFKQHCPIFAVVCDLETVPGFREFAGRFPKEQRLQRIGKRFPLAPETSRDKVLAMFDEGVQWICNALFPNRVYKLFQLEGENGPQFNEAVKGNSRLYQLLSQVRESRQRLGRILTKGLSQEGQGPLLFGGCYLAGTGKDANREQAFVAGVFRRLPEGQAQVAWTDEARAEDAACHAWANILTWVLWVLLLAIIGSGVWYFLF